MQGHGFDGAPLPDVPNTPAMGGASGLYSSAKRHAEMAAMASRPQSFPGR